MLCGGMLGFCCGYMAQCQEINEHGTYSRSDLLVRNPSEGDYSVAPGVLVEAPKAPIERDFHAYLHSRTTRALILGDYGVRILDAVSTRQVQDNPCKCMHEDELGPIVRTSLGMTAYSLAVATGIEFTAYKLWQHGHPKVARV